MIEIIKNKKMESLILNVLIIIILSITIIINSDDYKQIFLMDKVITNEEMMNDAIDNDKRFVTLDLTNAKLMRLSIENEKSKINTYKVTYDNYDVIIFLSENTALTNKVKGKLIKPVNEELEIKETLKNESERKIIDICFSNVDYIIDEIYIKSKLMVSIILITLLFVFSILDIIYFISPKRTRKYKKHIKKNKKA